MNKTGLSDKEWGTIKQILQEIPSIEKAVLFGSRAMGTARHNSDIDIMLFGEISPRSLAIAKNKLEETTLPYMFDLVLFDGIQSSLEEHVKAQGREIFSRH